MTDAGMCGESGGVACPFPVGWRLRGVALTLAWPPFPKAAASQGVVQQRKWKRVFGGGGTLGIPLLWLKVVASVTFRAVPRV